MAMPDRSDSRTPVWRRGEAATPWTEDEAAPDEPAADSGGDSAALAAPRQPQQAPDRPGPVRGSESGVELKAEPAETAQRSEPPQRSAPPQSSQALRSELPQADQASTDEQDHPPRQLHPLPRGLVELYGLLAVLFVLVPEWMASGALFGFREGRRGSELPAPSGAWKRLPELRLASLNLGELRLLARERGLIGYSRQGRQELTIRLLRHLKARPRAKRPL